MGGPRGSCVRRQSCVASAGGTCVPWARGCPLGASGQWGRARREAATQCPNEAVSSLFLEAQNSSHQRSGSGRKLSFSWRFCFTGEEGNLNEASVLFDANALGLSQEDWPMGSLASVPQKTSPLLTGHARAAGTSAPECPPPPRAVPSAHALQPHPLPGEGVTPPAHLPVRSPVWRKERHSQP